jgi:hypothetical protein
MKVELVERLQQEVNSLILIGICASKAAVYTPEFAQISGKNRSGFAFFGRYTKVKAANAVWSLGWETVSSSCAGLFTVTVLVVRC